MRRCTRCTLFFLFPLSLRVVGEHHLVSLPNATPLSNFRLRFNIGARLIRDDGFSGISSLYYKKASPRWTADVTCAFFVGHPVWTASISMPPLRRVVTRSFASNSLLKCVLVDNSACTIEQWKWPFRPFFLILLCFSFRD